MPITISSLFPFYSWIQLQLLKDDPILASASKGFNFGQLTVAPLTYVFYHSYSAVDAIQCDAANMTEVLASLPYLPPPQLPLPPPSTCKWFSNSSMAALSLPLNSTSPAPSDLPSSLLKASACQSDMTEEKWTRVTNAIGTMGLISMLAGVLPHEWDEDACVGLMEAAARRAAAPLCGSDCTPLGYCDSDCSELASVCGRVATFEVLEQVLPGGSFESGLTAIIGEDLAPCVQDILGSISGGGVTDACDSSAFTATSNSSGRMSFGSNPYEDCLPLSADPDSFLRNPSTSPDGSCALSRWDDYEADDAAVISHNARLVDEALNAAGILTSDDSDEDVPEKAFPNWRGIVMPLVVAVQGVLVFVGDLAAKRKGKKVVPAAASSYELEAGVARALSSRRFTEKVAFNNFYGNSGVFMALALVVQTSLAVYMGWLSEENFSSAEFEQQVSDYGLFLPARRS
jgi:hypothetical protein